MYYSKSTESSKNVPAKFREKVGPSFFPYSFSFKQTRKQRKRGFVLWHCNFGHVERERERGERTIPGLEWEFGKVRSSSSSAALYNNSGREEEAGNECARDARNGNESAHGREQPCPANI